MLNINNYIECLRLLVLNKTIIFSYKYTNILVVIVRIALLKLLKKILIILLVLVLVGVSYRSCCCLKCKGVRWSLTFKTFLWKS